MKILLVEDNPGDAVLAQEAFRATGSDQFNLDHVETLQAAITRLDVGDVDLVMLDLGLPDSRGLDTFHAVQPHLAGTPVVIVSGLDDETVAATAVLAGAQDYLVKGQFTPLSLVKAIQGALGRHSHALLKEILVRMQDLLDDTTREMKTLNRYTKEMIDEPND